MHLLLVAGQPIFPRLLGGAAMRSWAMIEALATRHQVIVSAPLLPELRPMADEAFATLGVGTRWADPAWATTPSLAEGSGRARTLLRFGRDLITHRLPFAFRKLTDAWARALVGLMQGTDAVICRHANLVPLLGAFPLKRVVIDADDILFRMRWREARSGVYGRASVLRGAEAARTWLNEQWYAQRCARVLVASSLHRHAFLTSRVTVVANGVSLPPETEGRPPGDGTIVFVGRCDYSANLEGLRWFVRDVWPVVQARRPGSRFEIVGRAATPAQLPFADAPGITCRADVPEVWSAFHRATLSVVPLFLGAGTRIKILESLACGTPVVSTPMGADGLRNDLSETHGLAIAPDATAMADRIVALLDQPDPWRAAAARGAELVRQEFSWARTMQPLLAGLPGWVPPRSATL